MFGILPFLWDWVSAPDYPPPTAITIIDAHITFTAEATGPTVTCSAAQVTITTTLEDE